METKVFNISWSQCYFWSWCSGTWLISWTQKYHLFVSLHTSRYLFFEHIVVSCTMIVGFATLPLHIGMIIIGKFSWRNKLHSPSPAYLSISIRPVALSFRSLKGPSRLLILSLRLAPERCIKFLIDGTPKCYLFSQTWFMKRKGAGTLYPTYCSSIPARLSREGI